MQTGRWFSCPRGAGTGGVKWADFNDPEVPGTDHDGTPDELKSISREAAAFLQKAVERGLNIFISGGTGSGKTTILNAMSGYIPQEDRVITIEDSAELQIRHVTNLVSLETRVENRDGSRRFPCVI